MNNFQPLNETKACMLNPFYDENYQPGPYITTETPITIKIDSREQELAILAAYDYGIDSLSEDGLNQLEQVIANLKLAITGS